MPQLELEQQKFSPFLQGVLLRGFILALVFSLFGKLDPFGLKAASSLHSEAIFTRFVGNWVYPDDKQNEVTVVLIDDEFLTSQDQSWPVSYDVLSGWIAEILMYEPSAVFIDILFRHQHGTEQELSVLLNTLNAFKDEIPIYIPLTIVERLGQNTCHPEVPLTNKSIDNSSVIAPIRELGLKHTYIKWVGCGARYPMYLGDNPELSTPAFSMFQEYCQSAEHKHLDICARMKSPDLIKKSFAKPMIIQWGGQVSKRQLELMDSLGLPCNEIGWMDHVLILFSQIFDSQASRGIRQQCPYTNTLSALLLLSSTPSSQEIMQEYLQGRYVFIGTHLEGVSDFIENPINGKVPGVYLLAMALDNLINYGHNYFQSLGSYLKIVLDTSVLFIVLVSIDLVSYFFRLKETAGGRQYILIMEMAWLRVLIIKILAPALFSLLIACFLWYEFDVAPVDWIGVSLIAFINNPISVYDSITEKIYKFIGSES